MRLTAINTLIILTFLLLLFKNESKGQPALINSYKVEQSKYNNAVSFSNNAVFCLISIYPDNYSNYGMQTEGRAYPYVNTITIDLPCSSKNVYRANYIFFETGVSPPISTSI